MVWLEKDGKGSSVTGNSWNDPRKFWDEKQGTGLKVGKAERKQKPRETFWSSKVEKYCL